MYSIYEELLRRDGIDSAEVSRKTGISQSTISNWKKRNNLISSENAVTLARFFNVSLDYLVTGSEYSQPAAPSPFLPADEQKLLDGYRRMNDIGKGKLTSYLDGLLQNGSLVADAKKERRA